MYSQLAVERVSQSRPSTPLTLLPLVVSCFGASEDLFRSSRFARKRPTKCDQRRHDIERHWKAPAILALGLVDVLRIGSRPFVSVLLPKSTHRGWIHQKQPEWRQQRLNRLPLPHGHGSLRPSFSSSNLFPCTMRIPRLTWVSDGKPLRRLLIGSKKGIIRIFVVHD